MNPACRRHIQAMLLAGAVAWPFAADAQQTGAAPPSAQGEAKKAPPKKAAAKKQAAAKPKADPAAAQSEVEAGVTALGQGRNDAAVASLSNAISAGSLPAAQSARALYYRGVAHRRQAKPAQAISDLTNALWIKNGLSEEQRADALQQRSAAYREAGLPEQGAPTANHAPKTATATSKAPAPAMFTAVAPAAPAGASSSGGGFFSSIFGGSTAPPEPAKPAAAPVATAPSQTSGSTANPSIQTGALVPRSTPSLPSGFHDLPGAGTTFYQGPSRSSGTAPQPSNAGAVASKPWDEVTQVKPAPAAEKAVGKAAPTARGAAATPEPKAGTQAQAKVAAVEKANIATAAKSGGGIAAASNFTVQVAAVRSAQEAQSVASRLRSGFARELGGRTPIVNLTTVENLGNVYRVQVGPYASAQDTQPLCAKLKNEGMDCRVVAH